jgi:hypothetical protein
MGSLSLGTFEKFLNCKKYYNLFNFNYIPSIRNTWSFDTRRVSANCLEVDKTNSCVYVGMDDGYLNTINLTKNTIGPKIKGHEISINAMGINPTNMNLYTVGSDGFLTTWQ